MLKTEALIGKSNITAHNTLGLNLKFVLYLSLTKDDK